MKFHLFNFRVHSTASMVPILNQINPIYTLPIYWFKLRFNIIILSMEGGGAQ